LINHENARARSIADAFDLGNIEEAEKNPSLKISITTKINDLFRQSNIQISINIEQGEKLMARKDGGRPYSIVELSDGERNALLIASDVLTARPKSLLVIDEPERHLHRSIISPLLSRLFEHREDCGFVVSTHDHDLLLASKRARTLLLRSCKFDDENNRHWEADEIPAGKELDDTLKRDLLGARRKIIFVEGTEASLDKALYSLIFPMVSVIPKGNSREVERAVVGVRAASEFHWLRAFGIVDGDGYEFGIIQEKKERGIYAIPFYSVESIYYHPKIIEYVSIAQASVSGGNANDLKKRALEGGINAVKKHTGRLAINAAKKIINRNIQNQIPNDDELMSGQDVNILNDAIDIRDELIRKLDKAVANDDWETILTKCPVRESNARRNIVMALKFIEEKDYENAVRHQLSQNREVLKFTRGLFSDLCDQLEIELD